MLVETNAIHVREHGSILADAEKRVLLRIAHRLPSWIGPDHLTMLGLASMALAGFGFWLARVHETALLVVIAALALNWFGDSLDGTVARVRNRQRPRYGYYVDHVVDIFGTAMLLVGLALSGYMNPLLALALLAAFLMVEAEVFLAAHTHGVFRLSFLRVGPTELRIVLAAGTLYLLHSPWVTLGAAGRYRLFDVGGVVSVVALIVVLAVSAFRNGRALYAAERLR
jgi:phosphatidylglycerophosphate synthase